MCSNAPLPLELEGDDVALREDAQTWESVPNGAVPNGDTNTNELPQKIHGSDKFQTAFKILAGEYSGVFSRTLKAEPANIPHLHLDVDESKWHVPSNTAAPRMHSTAKGDEIARQVAQMTEINLIERSLTPYHSHVHLVAKPNGKWRFTIDFRHLNAATRTKLNWPLPNIKEMLAGPKAPPLLR
jgi:hypothetical protein